jgi:hypothetical protein
VAWGLREVRPFGHRPSLSGHRRRRVPGSTRFVSSSCSFSCLSILSRVTTLMPWRQCLRSVLHLKLMFCAARPGRTAIRALSCPPTHLRANDDRRTLSTLTVVLAPTPGSLRGLPALSTDAHNAVAREWVDGFKEGDIPKEALDVGFARSSGPGGQVRSSLSLRDTADRVACQQDQLESDDPVLHRGLATPIRPSTSSQLGTSHIPPPHQLKLTL